jgi:hypothetical protein
MRRVVLFAALICGGAYAQQTCPNVPTYSPCEIAVQLNEAEARQHTNPYLTVEVQAEFRSPKYRTFLMPGFWDGGRRVVFRFSPDEPGTWTYRLSGNLAATQEVTGKFTAVESDSAGFIKPANVHHWIYTERLKPHLWMGDTFYKLATADRTFFDRYVEERARQKFTHVRGLVIGWDEAEKLAFPAPDQPSAEYFRELDRRVAALHAKGIVTDLILGGDKNSLARMFPSWQQRERYVRYVAARYAAYNVTWQLVQEYEGYENARAVMKALGEALQKYDPYGHPRTTHTYSTSAPLVIDKWMNYITYQSSDNALGSIEHQAFPLPQVNAEFGYEDSGAGKKYPHHVSSEEFRKRLWNATMNGQWPTFGNTGVYGGRFLTMDTKYLDSPGAKAMTAWFDLISKTRFWELEPYFYLDGGRALALPGVEYIVYVEKGATVEMLVEKHGYDVHWMNPATGEYTKEKKDFKEETFKGTAPTATEDWVLHLSRDGHKEGMLKSYRFESQPNEMQEPEVNPAKIPFELTAPAAQEEIPVAVPIPFSIKVKKETPGTRRMMYILTGEDVRDGQGYRFLASGKEGTFVVPKELVQSLPAALSVRVGGLNAAGKLYILDANFPLK